MNLRELLQRALWRIRRQRHGNTYLELRERLMDAGQVARPFSLPAAKGFQHEHRAIVIPILRHKKDE